MMKREADHELCNIGFRGQKQRYFLAMMMYICSFVLLVWMIVTEASAWLRMLLFIPLFIGALGYFQARDKTCVHLAARGMKSVHNGQVERIEDPRLNKQLQQRAASVWLKSVVTAIVITVLLFFIAF
jgi:hypothetical protein